MNLDADTLDALGYGDNVWEAYAPEVSRLHEAEKAADRQRKATARANPETWARELEATRERVRKARAIVRQRVDPRQLSLFGMAA